MVHSTSWFFGLALVPFVLAGSSSYTVRSPQYHEARTSIPSGFASLGPASPDQTLKLRFALSQTDPEGLIKALYDVSDPSSPNYGKHLSKAETEQYVAPKPASLGKVNTWLREHNISGTAASPAGDWISFQLPVSQANELFSANFSTFKDTHAGIDVVRTLAYALPAELQGHVDFIHPTVSFATPASGHKSIHAKRSFMSATKRDNVPAACVNGTTPTCLQYVYKIPATPAVNEDNQLGVTGRQGGIAGYSFLETFLETLRPDIDPTTNFTVIGIDGGSNNNSLPGVSEGNLDIQYTVGVATGVPVVYVFVGEQNQDGEYDGWLDEVNYLLAQENPPQVMTR